MTNSTVSGNTAGNNAGGIYNGGELFLVHCTVTQNSSPSGGGIVNGVGDVLELQNTIVANNLGGGDFAGDPPISLGFNLDSDGSGSLAAAGDLSSVNPMLGALTDNGGITMTHALISGSAAIDAIPAGNCGASTDQRHVSRSQGAGCDIGAYELEATCTLSLEPTFRQGDLLLEITVGTTVPATVSLWAFALGNGAQVVSAPVPAINPATTFSLGFPVPPLGTVGLLVLLHNSDGVLCHDFQLVDTGL